MSEALGSGLRVVLGSALDGGAWTGGAESATAGTAWLGPRGFLARLELELGIPTRNTPEVVRAARLVPRLRATPGFWDDSARVDVLGTAERLLQLRDSLVTEGWLGEPVSRRLAALWEVTDSVPGVADRLRRLPELIEKTAGTLRISSVAVTPGRLPQVLERILGVLATRRVAVSRQESRVQGPPSRPVMLLRPRGTLEAAQEAAAWLASAPTDQTVVIGASPALDEALHSFGLPRSGARANATENPYVLSLTLALELAFPPSPPRVVLDLLELPVSPLPAAVSQRLRRALGVWPSVGSPAWKDALARAVAELPSEARDETVRRLKVIFEPSAQSVGSCSRGSIDTRAVLVQHWLEGELSASELAHDARSATRARDALASVLAFREALTACGLDSLTAIEVRRLSERALAQAAALPRHVAEAGLHAVARPGGVIGPVRRLLWWSFGEPAGHGAENALTRAEREALKAIGIRVRERWKELAEEAGDARRAISHATDAVVLVHPERDETGRPRALPSLTLELAGVQHCARLPHPPGGPSLVRVACRSLPHPRREWTLGAAAIRRREFESPSSLTSLIGCSFRWGLLYQARVSSTRTTLLDGAVLNGLLAHELVARAVRTNVADPRSLFDAEAPRLAAPLFLPGRDADRARVRAVIVRAVEELRQLLATENRNILSSEAEVEDTKNFVVPLKGRPDLVLGPSPLVLDLKWGGRRHHEDALARGTAIQLALYAHLVRTAGALSSMPPVAYYVLSTARFLAATSTSLPGAWTVGGPPAEATFEALRQSIAQALDDLGRGELEARGIPTPGAPPDEIEDALANGTLTLVPPCRSCSFDGLCGRAFVAEGGP